MLAGLALYAAMLALATFLHGAFVNERAERLAWESLLSTELDHHLKRGTEPGYRWQDTDNLHLYAPGLAEAPPALAALAPGLHDEVAIDGRQYVALVRMQAGKRVTLALDITDLERAESTVTGFVLS